MIYDYPPTSRYYGISTATITDANGEQTIYLRRRFLPLPSRFALLQNHIVTEGERLDQIAAQHLGDPEAWWRIADANSAMRPEFLTETPGRSIRITLPEGIPAPATNA